VCNHDNGKTRFFGIISKEKLLQDLEQSRILYSSKNQEKFRVVPLERFAFEELLQLMAKMERI